MPRFLLTWLITAVSLIITAKLVPGITISSFGVAAIAAIVLGLINAIVRPLLVLFTLPLTILTLGLFLFVINAISFGLVGYFVSGFQVNGFLDALFGSIILSFVSGILSSAFATVETNE